MPLITLETVFDPVAAELMRMRLEAGGIDAVLFDNGIASLIGAGLSGVRVMVLDEDEADARSLLASHCTKNWPKR
jgi:Putative prokaryotic signal transducing protein